VPGAAFKMLEQYVSASSTRTLRETLLQVIRDAAARKTETM
jgi:hypothetical protein